MRVGQDFAGVLASPARHAGRAEDAHDLVLAALPRPFLDDRVERRTVLPARLLGRETWVARQLGPADGRREGRPHLLLRGDERVVVRTARRAWIGRARDAAAHLVAAARHRLTKTLVVAQADPNDVDDRILHRHLDMLPAPRGVALLQCRQDTD